MAQIRSLRERAGFSQEELANRLSVTQSAVSQWEAGICTPRTKLLKNLAETLECTIDELLKG